MLPKGIVPVLQTPFTASGDLDRESLSRLVEYTIAAGASGLLAPAVASEVDYLSIGEREEIISLVASEAGSRIPFIVGASAETPEESRQWARLAERVGASAYLVAPPARRSAAKETDLVDFFRSVASGTPIPLVIQDLDWSGSGLSLSTIARLKETIPSLAGLKIETLPAGPKYSTVKRELGDDFFVAGGWAIAQLIEALDRGVDAMIPESSMVPVYAKIYDDYAQGQRGKALHVFQKLLYKSIKVKKYVEME